MSDMVLARLGEPGALGIAFFVLFIVGALGISYWAARRTRTTAQFYCCSAAPSCWSS